AVALEQPYRFITSIFLHGGFAHIFYNMFAMFMFAPLLEHKVGTKHFIIILLLSGITGSVLYYITVLLGIIPPLPALGASGAIYGILGALSILMPDLVIYFWFFPMKMRNAAILWILIEFIGSFNPYSGIASAAHLGGLLFGIAYANLMLKRQETYDEWY
ncbi:MAG: rhomboid family intramembrane serine protease, partial [Candidatus Micrarchaeia archaeon]